MKASYKKLVILINCFISISAFAQNPDSVFLFLDHQFDQNWKPNQLKIVSNANASSNAINTAMFTDVLLRSSFTPDAKQMFIDNEKNKTNVDAGYGVNIEYKWDSLWGIYAKNGQQSYFSMDNNMSKLLLFGNASYAGKTVSSKNPTILRYATTNVGLTRKLTSTEKWQIKLSAGVSAMYNYTAYNAKNIQFFTAKDGAFVDVVAENATWVNKENTQAGYGIDVNLDAYFKPNSKHTFLFQLGNLNTYFVPKGNRYKVDTSFRFEGVSYTLNPQNSEFNFSADSTINSLLNKSKEAKEVVFLPFNVNVEWAYNLNKNDKIGILLYSTGLGNYGNYAAVNYTQNLTSSIKLQSTVAYGNFTNWQWNEAIEFHVKSTNFFISAVGLNALLSPRISHSYGIAFGIIQSF